MRGIAMAILFVGAACGRAPSESVAAAHDIVAVVFGSEG